MKYEDFQKFIEQNCCYETIYDDSEGRAILVMRLLDAYGMVNKAVEIEREECAKVAAWILKMPENDVSAAIRARGQG